MANKQEITSKMSEQLSFSKKDSLEILNAIIDIITESLIEDEVVNVTGFGRFKINERAPRKGINPATGKIIQIPKKFVINFKASNIIKKQINE